MTDSNKKKILIVDDELSVGRSIRKAIESDGYDIDVALSGDDVLQRPDLTDYDVMVVDLMMPGVSGLDLLKTIKTRAPAVQVIIITGYPTMKNTLQAIQMGAVDFLPKPFEPSDLRAMIVKALEARDQERKKSSTA